MDSETDLTDVDAFAGKDDGDEAWLCPNEDHPPAYYLQQLESFDDQEYTNQDYKDSSTRLLNRMVNVFIISVSLGVTVILGLVLRSGFCHSCRVGCDECKRCGARRRQADGGRQVDPILFDLTACAALSWVGSGCCNL